MLSAWLLESLTIKKGSRISVSAAFHSMAVRIEGAILDAVTFDRQVSKAAAGRPPATCKLLSSQ